MKCVFVHRMGPDFASYRYRAEIPAKELGATVNGGEGAVFVFSKPTPDDLVLAKECKAEGVKVVVDLGDDHFRHRMMGQVYVDMVQLCDALVTPTENMAGRIMKYVGRKADAIIPDPYEEALTAPHASGVEAKYLWCASASNIKDLDGLLPFLKEIPLTVMTGPNNRQGLNYIKWTIDGQHEQLRSHHIVLVPHRKGVEYKSPNRLVNAILAGCFVVGSEHPSHSEFRRYAWIGNVFTGVKWAQHFQDELNDIVAEGQAYCEKFSPAKIGAQWKQLLESLH